MKTLVTLFLVLLLGGGTEVKKPKNSNVILVLRSTLNKEYFSKFNVTNFGRSLLGENLEYGDYPVPSGIYRIESASNDDYLSRRIIINQEDI